MQIDLKALREINLKTIAVPLVVLIALVILAFFGANFTLGKIGELNEEERSLSDKRSTLSQKVGILEDFSLTGSSVSARLSQAIPIENPGVLGISQIKLKSAALAVSPEKINVGKSVGDPANLSYVLMDFEISGELGAAINFLNALVQTAPLGKIDNIKFTKSDLGYDTDVTYKGYWSILPQTIPSVESPLSPFSEEELAIISTLASLEAPPLETVNPQPESSRVNPFGI